MTEVTQFVSTLLSSWAAIAVLAALTLLFLARRYRKEFGSGRAILLLLCAGLLASTHSAWRDQRRQAEALRLENATFRAALERVRNHRAEEVKWEEMKETLVGRLKELESRLIEKNQAFRELQRQTK